MTEDLKEYESTIKKVSRFNFWTVKFEEEFHTDLYDKVFVPIVLKTFERLEWDLVYQDELSAEAKRKNKWDTWTEKISVTFEHGNVKVKSISLGNEIWDAGRNSLRVRLFIYAFQQIEKEFDRAALQELEKEVERENNWDDYEIPESLPQPKEKKKARFGIPLVGGVLTALLIGYVVAFLSTKGMYVHILFEFGMAFIMGAALTYLLKVGNYTHFDRLRYLLIGMVAIMFISDNYTQYQFFLDEADMELIGFFEFMRLKFEAGLEVKSSDMGSIGLVISWIVQVGLTYLIGTWRLAAGLTSYQLERVPMEVVDFAMYHFVKEKNESQVRDELSRMGWTDFEDQNAVFEALGALQESLEINRME